MGHAAKRTLRIAGSLGMVTLLIAAFGCKKKDRLTTPNYLFTITPPAAQVVRANTKTLTAQKISPAGTTSVSPTWTVSDSAVGVLNTYIGPSVQFTANALGDVVVSATLDGEVATTQIAVVAFAPSSSVFEVYVDQGLPSGSDVVSDIDTNLASLQEISTGYTPEGILYQRGVATAPGGFWGVTLDDNNAGLTRDLSSFTGGTLKLAIRLSRALTGGESVRVNIEDAGTTAIFTIGPAQGFQSSSVAWQEISIPLSNYFSTVDETRIKVPFAVAVLVSSNLTFDVDAVRWER